MTALTEADLLRDLSGTVLEIGPGSGDHMDDLPSDIHWIGLEPDAEVLDDLRRNANKFSSTATVIQGVAERIPRPDDSVDAVVSRFVLCSVADQALSLAEVRRVLKPGGRFTFIEHVGGPRLRPVWFLQKLWALPTARKAGACDPSRQTLEVIEAAGFAQVEVEHFSERGPLGIPLAHIIGTARIAQ